MNAPMPARLPSALPAVLLMVAGCAPTPYQQALDARDEVIPPPGSTVTLGQPLELSGDSARVFVQNGRILRFQDRDRFEPWCSFGLRRRGEEPLIRTIEPDHFITGPARNRAQARAVTEHSVLVASRRMSPWLLGLSPASMDRGGGLGHLTFIIELPLRSDTQPQVDNLVCGMDRPAYWRGRIALGEIREALGEIASIRPAT